MKRPRPAKCLECREASTGKCKRHRAPLCPECCATLQRVTDGTVGEQYWPGYLLRHAEAPWRRVQRPFYACPECEFCIEERDWRP